MHFISKRVYLSSIIFQRHYKNEHLNRLRLENAWFKKLSKISTAALFAPHHMGDKNS
jgi:hypothetical protein